LPGTNGGGSAGFWGTAGYGGGGNDEGTYSGAGGGGFYSSGGAGTTGLGYLSTAGGGASFLSGGNAVGSGAYGGYGGIGGYGGGGGGGYGNGQSVNGQGAGYGGGGGGGGYSGGAGGSGNLYGVYNGGGGGSLIDASAITNLAEVSGVASPDGSPNGEIIIVPVYSRPVITSNPASASVLIGRSATFAPGVFGSPPLAAQWYFNNAIASGATNPVLTIAPALTNAAGYYQLVVTNLYGSATSAPALLTVLVQPNIYALAPNGNGTCTLSLASLPGSTNRLWASTNLVTWQILATNTAAATGLFQFIDPNTAGLKLKYYRLSTP